MATTMVDITGLPAIPFAERKTLPDEPAVYFVLDASGAVLYIGRSISVARRWETHHRLKNLRQAGAHRIAWLTVSDTVLLDQVERGCIAQFQPPLNGVVTYDESTSHPVLLRVPYRLYIRLREEAERRILPDATTVLQLMRERLDQIDGGDGHE